MLRSERQQIVLSAYKYEMLERTSRGGLEK